MLKLRCCCMLKLPCQGFNPIPTQHQWETFNLIRQFIVINVFQGSSERIVERKKGGAGWDFHRQAPYWYVRRSLKPFTKIIHKLYSAFWEKDKHHFTQSWINKLTDDQQPSAMLPELGSWTYPKNCWLKVALKEAEILKNFSPSPVLPVSV